MAARLKNAGPDAASLAQRVQNQDDDAHRVKLTLASTQAELQSAITDRGEGPHPSNVHD